MRKGERTGVKKLVEQVKRMFPITASHTHTHKQRERERERENKQAYSAVIIIPKVTNGRLSNSERRCFSGKVCF